jgi:SprB repeat
MLCIGAAHAQLNVSLSPSNHNGYNISCFGGGDGAIDLSVTGGTPPYTYIWSTGATTQDVSGLRAGYISVAVIDASNADARADMTLTEPDALDADFTPYVYTSGHNISCNNCYNGSIAVTISGGVHAYTYAWNDGPTTEDRSQLDAGNYNLDVTDANGCVYRGPQLTLTQPERDDWSRAGNAGTDPNTQFIGTTDNKDVVFKSNGAERLRLKSGGDVQVSSLAATGAASWSMSTGAVC